MVIRDARPDDTGELIALFKDTVRHVNLADYSPAQVAAWAPDDIDAEAWRERQARNRTLLAEIEGDIVGFAELQDGARVHMLYVQKDHQGHGIASALLARIETIAAHSGARGLTVDASVTARPFFAHKGFTVVAPQTVTRGGQSFRNFRMEKTL
jgi:putative acetyltransferase